MIFNDSLNGSNEDDSTEPVEKIAQTHEMNNSSNLTAITYTFPISKYGYLSTCTNQKTMNIHLYSLVK